MHCISFLPLNEAGRAGGNKNEPLDAGSPKLAQRFVSILPEMNSLSTSGHFVNVANLNSAPNLTNGLS